MFFYQSVLCRTVVICVSVLGYFFTLAMATNERGGWNQAPDDSRLQGAALVEMSFANGVWAAKLDDLKPAKTRLRLNGGQHTYL